MILDDIVADKKIRLAEQKAKTGEDAAVIIRKKIEALKKETLPPTK